MAAAPAGVADPAERMGIEDGQVAAWDRDMALLVEEAMRLRRRSHDVFLPASLSASQMLTLRADPDELARQMARPMPRKPQPAARLGVRFHAWIEARFGQQQLIVDDELPGAADAEIDDEFDLAALRRSFEGMPYANRAPYAVEAAFRLPIGGRVIRGRIDAVYETSDGYDVIDWKTNKSHTADPLQLAIYRIAWAEMHELPLNRVGAAFVYVRTGEVIRPTGLPDRRALESLLAETIDEY
jgi:DNA helicase-2/ATP-dependent DNA helicase PcrA